MAEYGGDHRLPPSLGGIESVCRRYTRAVTRRNQWATLYRECYDYALPARETFTKRAEGQEVGQELFDSTAETATHEFASRLQATICPPWRDWSLLTPGPGLPKELRQNSSLAEQLQEQTNIFFSYLNHSNFALKSHESFLDLAIGMGALRVELNETGDGLQFDCIPISRLAIEDGPFGTIETTFEDKCLPVRVIQRLYRGKVQMPPDWTRRGQEEQEKSFVQGVVYAPKTRDYHLVVFCEQPKMLMYYAPLGATSPDIVFRWTVVPGEIHGRGPVMSALPDIRTLNKVVEYMLRGAALTLAPPMTGVSDGVLNPYTAVIAPDTIIPVSSNDNSNPSLRPLMTSIKPELAQFILADMRQAVRQKLLADPRRREGPIQSATEILVEDREFVQQTGAAFGRIQAEFIERVVTRVVDLLQRTGRMAKLNIDGVSITLKHTSPLSRAQDNEELMALQNFAALTQAAAGPEAYQLGVKIEEVPEYVARKTGVPASLIRTSAERDQKIKQLAEVMQAAQDGGQPGAAPAAPAMGAAA